MSANTSLKFASVLKAAMRLGLALLVLLEVGALTIFGRP